MLRLLKLSSNTLLQRQLIQKYQLSCGIHSQEKVTHKFVYAKELAEKNLDKLELGASIHGFIVDEVERIDVFDLLAIRLTHSRTGAQYLHLARDDTNNVFCVAFRTTPSDSTGLPHILEHMALCGSQKYPVRDPFFKMLRRSLATFMNAMTGFDYTMYPFSTTNYKDFKNLRSVYLDAAFRPNLRELDFKQEGWRLEHENVDDKNSPIIFKGVVFNEMKGVFSETENLFQYRFFNKILPSHTYGVVSGGDPLVIPTLKYDDLVNFHRTYYHPSNSRLFSYGTLPLEEHLQYINEEYLSLFSKLDSSMSKVPSEKRWDKVRYCQIECKPNPLIPDSKRSGTIGFGYLCNDICDVDVCLDMSIVADLLLSGPQSPFYKSLIESKLATTYGSLTGYHPFTKDVPFALSLVGVEPATFGQVEKTFNETVYKVAEEGFTDQQVKAAMHCVELKLKHIPRNFGMQLLHGLTSRWNHDGDLMRSLKINEVLESFEAQIKRNPKYIQQLVEKYLINNQHKLICTMVPKEDYISRIKDAEDQLLKHKLRNLSSEELNRIYINGQILRAEQEKEENVAVLPILDVKDVKSIPLGGDSKTARISTVPVQIYRGPTNGVCYYRAVINIKNMPPDMKDLLPLFNSAITQMGTQNYDYRAFSEMIQLKTDGLDFSVHVATDKTDHFKHEEGVLISSSCLDRNLCDMWKLWEELFNNVTLNDVGRFETIVKSYTSALVEGIADTGHTYAMQSAASLISPSYEIREKLTGITSIKRIKKIAQQEHFDTTLSNIRGIAKFLLNKRHLRSSIHASQTEDELFRSINRFYESLKGTCKEPQLITSGGKIKSKTKAIHYVLPFAVNYCSKAISTVPYTNPEHASLRVLAPLISSIYLHPEIREKGGAYGGGANLSPNGIFFFYSYRDPNSVRTFHVFDKTCDFLKNYALTDNDLSQAKLQVLQKYCLPVTPSNRGVDEFLEGLTDEMRMSMIESVKATTKEDVIAVAEKYLRPGIGVDVARVLIGAENQELLLKSAENWKVETERD